MLLNGKAGIITGAGTGIGRACAIRFAKSGAKTALIDISEQNLAETKALVLEQTPEAEVICITADVSVEKSVAAAIDEAAKTFGKINYAMNNAGVMMTRAPVAEVPSEDWEHVMRVNLFGAFYCAKHEIRHMLKTKEPCSIVFTSSVGGLIGTPEASDYVCSKHAVIGLAKCIMADYSEYGIRSNAICPGQIETPMWETVIGESDPEIYAKISRTQNPMRRLGRPEEIASVAAFLVSDESSHITGVALPVDGGHVATNATYFNWE